MGQNISDKKKSRKYILIKNLISVKTFHISFHQYLIKCLNKFYSAQVDLDKYDVNFTLHTNF